MFPSQIIFSRSNVARSLVLLFFFFQTFGAQTPDESEADLIRSSLSLVHYGDIVDVDVVGSFENDWRGGITPEGFLDGLDQLSTRIYALCRSESELESLIAKEFSATLRNPTVQVRIVDRSARPSAVLEGAVKLPHRFQIRRPVRLNELIIIAGGLTDTAGGDIRVFRSPNAGCKSVNRTESDGTIPVSQGERPEVRNFTIADLLKGSRAANPYIMPGDIVSIMDSPPVYLIGGVSNPGRIAYRQGLTVSRAIATAGGVAKVGDEENTTIFRREKGQSKVIEVSLSAIGSKTIEDPVLSPYDIVEVAIKDGEKRKFPPLIEIRDNSVDSASKFPLRIID